MNMKAEVRRFTIDGGGVLETKIAEDVRAIAAKAVSAVGGRDITAVILGGGYGRGEGAVWRENGDERVYNDYDLFVVTPSLSRSRSKQISGTLREVGKRMESAAGIHVDFGRPLPQSNLSSLPYELMMMELKMGHVVLHGPRDILSSMPNYDEKRPPLIECTRLLMNRSVGLIQARQLSAKRRSLSDDEKQFAIRNTQKAMMAAGDAVLFVNQTYSASYAQRLRLFDGLSLKGTPKGELLRDRYHEAINFKLHPSHKLPAGKTLAAWIEESAALFGSVFLWFERRRLDAPEMGWDDYMARPFRLPAPTLLESIMNAARNIRGKAFPLTGVKGLLLHPRDHILRAAPKLLYSDGTPEREAAFFRLWELYS
jgi:hypothetical protein